MRESSPKPLGTLLDLPLGDGGTRYRMEVLAILCSEPFDLRKDKAESLFRVYERAHPNKDLVVELSKAQAWALSNRRKKNYARFLTNWLARKGGTPYQEPPGARRDDNLAPLPPKPRPAPPKPQEPAYEPTAEERQALKNWKARLKK